MSSSRGSTCIRCGAPDAYSCHYNGPRQHSYGRGRGIKASDIATAEFCHACDQVFSEGSVWSDGTHWSAGVVSRWERSEEFAFYIIMTNIRRLENGVLKVG